jgi:hypothetical protein
VQKDSHLSHSQPPVSPTCLAEPLLLHLDAAQLLIGLSERVALRQQTLGHHTGEGWRVNDGGLIGSMNDGWITE